MNKERKTAIVTGASKGIGAAIAKRLAADGFQVIVNYAASEAAALAVVAEIGQAGGSARAVQADVADAAAMHALFDQTESAYGLIDVLVNNAGISKTDLLAQVTDEDFQRLVAVNLTGVFNGMREGARRIRNGGRIVNLSTSLIGSYQPTVGIYTATKAAVEAMTHVLAKELGGRGITVNAIAPGPVATGLLLAGRSEASVKQLVDGIPLGRLGEPADIAGIVSFLASADGGWVSGQVIKANGGRN